MVDVGSITLANLWAFLIAAAAGIAAIAKVIEIIAGRISPKRQRERSVDEKLQNDNDRIESLEKFAKAQEKTNAVLFRALLAQINHELDGNHVDGLRDSRDEIQRFLTER